MWSEPALEDWSKLNELRGYRDSPWLAKLLELTGALVDLSRGRFPVVMCLQRGPLDVAAALRGNDRICLDLYDSPRQLAELLDICAEANLYVAQRLADCTPSFLKGHVNYFGLWAPGWPYLHQEDAMELFSQDAYAQLLRDLDHRIMSSFTHSLRKFHTASLHILEEGLKMISARGIQITIDPNGPPVAELVRVFSEIQQKKPLLVNCGSKKNADRLAGELPARGLCLFY